MLIGHLSDIHLMDSFLSSGTGISLYSQQVALQEIITQLVNRKVELLVISGDMSGRDAPHKMTWQELHTLFDLIDLALRDMAVLIFSGNHDRDNDLAILSRMIRRTSTPESHVLDYADSVDMHSWMDSNGHSIDIQVCPYRSKLSILKEMTNYAAHDGDVNIDNSILKFYMNKYIWSQSKLMFAHGPVVGGRVGDFVIKSARDMNYTPESLEQTGIPYIGLGHYHDRQQVAKNAWYAGSPYPLNFSETGDKGFSIIDIHTLDKAEREWAADVEHVNINHWSLATFNFHRSLSGGFTLKDHNYKESPYVACKFKVFTEDRTYRSATSRDITTMCNILTDNHLKLSSYLIEVVHPKQMAQKELTGEEYASGAGIEDRIRHRIDTESGFTKEDIQRLRRRLEPVFSAG